MAIRHTAVAATAPHPTGHHLWAPEASDAPDRDQSRALKKRKEATKIIGRTT